METSAITAIIGVLSVITGGVLAFAREAVKNAREDSVWWRDKGFAVLEKQQETLEAQVRADEERDAKVDETLTLLKESREEEKHGDR